MTNTEMKRGSADPQLNAMQGHRAQRIDSTTLLGSGREIVIVHQNDEYRLRITKNGKLILTK